MMPPRPRRDGAVDGPVGLRALARARAGGVVASRPARTLDPSGRRAVMDRGGLSGAVLFVVSNLAYFCAAAMIPAHLLFAVEVHSGAVRLLTAIPGIVLILEARHYLKNEAGELPFVVLALVQYYATFCFGVFFDLKFYDFRGPVILNPDARLSGAVAVSIGVFGLWVGARLGRRLGKDLQPWIVRAMPPSQVPEEWDRALYLYVGATVLMAFALTLAPGMVPASLTMPVLYAFSMELAMGFALVVPPQRLGPRFAQLMLGVQVFIGMLQGTLDTLFRGAIAYSTGHWAAVRTISVRIIVAVFLAFVILQPVKSAYRDQVWAPAARTGQQVGMADRVGAWENAFSGYFSGSTHSSVSEDGGMQRMSELASVMHAFQVLPGRVEFLDGAGFLSMFYSPIPRFIWPNKPTTQETVQRYGVIFGRQNDAGARTTAIALPLLVEGYWNLGWPGIVLVTVAVGLWLGAAQKMFAGEHWAMRATGIANITNVTVVNPVVYTYGSLFQIMTGRIGVCWAVFWLATMLSRRRYDARRPRGGRALARAGR